MKKIAIASGKGGTGKTTVSVLLSKQLSKNNKVQLLDCDVENPNSHIFFKSASSEKKDIKVFYPEIDLKKCSLCGKCQEVCEYNCLLVLKDKVMFFPEMCHPCKGCLLVCPEHAVSTGYRKTGYGYTICETPNLQLDTAVMNVGEARANPLIEELKDNIKDEMDYVIIDSPPGANCPMVEAVSAADYVVLVTEPTLFGLYDLEIAWKVINKLKIPVGIVINRSEGNDEIITDFASRENVPVIFKIPFSRSFAESYSKGELNGDCFPELKNSLEAFMEKFKK